MVGVIIWLIVVLLICFSVFGGLWLLPIYLLFCIVHSKTTILICYLLDYQQVHDNANVSIILLGDKKEPTK